MIDTHKYIRNYNRRAWDAAVQRRSQWTVPVGPEIIAAARRGEWSIILTPTRTVPSAWFPPIVNTEVLCLAGGGGQQAPILAAAGAKVTSFDNSPRQLGRDRQVAEREELTIRTVEGDMADLSVFANASFDLIVHPCSNLFVPDVRPVWREAHRVLKPGGLLLSGFYNPIRYIFDAFLLDKGIFEVKHKLPYADTTHLTAEERQRLLDDLQPLEFSHTLEAQIGGQIEAGFALTGFLEDRWEGDKLDEYTATFIMTRAEKRAA